MEDKPPPKAKSKRTPEQLEALAKAREKALQIRKENAELRKAEKQIEKEQKEAKIEERKEKVKNYKKKELIPSQVSTPNIPPVEEEEIEEVEIQKPKPKPKKKKKVIIVESSDSEEEEVVMVKKKKEKKLPSKIPIDRTSAPPQLTTTEKLLQMRKAKAQANYNKMYSDIFGRI
jgi:hypothetical protein